MDGGVAKDLEISILYVDDDQVLLDVGKLYIEMSGCFKVTTADSAEEGLNILKERSFDCIISDYQMPDMDGIEFLRELRKTDQNTPFIVFTGKGRDEVEGNALCSGADFYVRKGGDAVMQYKDLIHKVFCSVSARRTGKKYKNPDIYSREFIYVYDPGKGFKSASRHYCELLDMEDDEIIGKDYQGLGFPKETYEFLYGLHENVCRTKNMVSVISPLRMPDGITNHYKVVFVPIFGEGGSVVGIGSKGEIIAHNAEQ